jgi:hypothetical protein
VEDQFHAFVSYARKELAPARRLAKGLSTHGLRLWVAGEQKAPETTWQREVLDFMRRLPATVLVVGKRWPPAGWRLRELGEIERRKLVEPSFRFVVVVLPGAKPPRDLSVAPDNVIRLDPKWDAKTLAAIAVALTGEAAPSIPVSESISLSESVEAATRVSREVTSFAVVRRLLELHPEYAKGRVSADDLMPPRGAARRTAADWVARVCELYDPARAKVLHGRLLIDGLARVDGGLRARLDKLGALVELRAEIEPSPDRLLRVKPDSVDTLTDYPAAVDGDELGRMVIAEVLARRIRAMRADEIRRHAMDRRKELRQGGPFLLHLYGEWGTGKTSLLRFIRWQLEGDTDAVAPSAQPRRTLLARSLALFEGAAWRAAPQRLVSRLRARRRARGSRLDVANRWVVIDFNAWQHQRIVPPWWWLMSAVYRQGSRALWRLDKWRWTRLKLWDAAWRIKGATPGVLLAATGLLIAWLVWKSGSFDRGKEWGSVMSATESVVKALSAVVALFLTVWGGVRALGRWLVAGSPRVAGSFLAHARDPLETLSRRFATLVCVIDYPVAIFVDDLDRCQGKYVVELLEGIQTLFNTVPIAYVVAADRDWLCQSYVEEYPGFADKIGDPGRPMGYLFLEKTFQLSAPVPALSTGVQRDFWNGLLRVTRPAAQTELQEARLGARAKYESLKNEAQIQEELRRSPGTSPVEQQAEAEAAVLRLAHPDLEERTQHTLEVFAPLLERNPRSMKRLVNAYGMARATEIIRGVRPNEDASSTAERVALWTILSLRWPLLADYLAEDEKAADRIRGGENPPEGPPWLRKLWRDPAVVKVLNGDAPTVTTVLDAAAVCLSAGKDLDGEPRRVSDTRHARAPSARPRGGSGPG